MLHIVLTILKVIGIVLLVIIGLILLLCTCILFVPVRYSARVTYKDKLTVRAKVTYLLHIVSAEYIRKENQGKTTLKIFGIRTHFFDEEKKKTEKQFEEETEMFEKMSEEMNAAKESDEHLNRLNAVDRERDEIVLKEKTIDDMKTAERKNADVEDTDNIDTDNEGAENKGTDCDDTDTMQNDKSEKTSVFAKVKNKIKKIFNKIKYRFKKICGTIRKMYKNINGIKEFLQDEKTKEAFSFVKGEAGKLIKHVKPRRIKGYLTFGFDDPSYTGKMLGIIYMFSRGARKNFQINPDFENKVLESDVQLKGRIQGYFLLIIAYRLYKNKNFREVLEKRRTYGRE